MTSLNGLGFVATALNLLAFLPAMLHVIISRSSCGISMYTLFLRILASILWIVFAFENGILPTQISGFLTIAFVLVYMVLVLRYSSNCHRSPWAFPFNPRELRSLWHGTGSDPNEIVYSDLHLHGLAKDATRRLRLRRMQQELV